MNEMFEKTKKETLSLKQESVDFICVSLGRSFLPWMSSYLDTPRCYALLTGIVLSTNKIFDISVNLNLPQAASRGGDDQGPPSQLINSGSIILVKLFTYLDLDPLIGPGNWQVRTFTRIWWLTNLLISDSNSDKCSHLPVSRS